MLSTPPVVRAQLSEALTVMSTSDFPARWPQLLPVLIERLRSGAPGIVLGVLETANSIYKRYRNQFMTPALSEELEYSQSLVRMVVGDIPLLLYEMAIKSAVQICRHDAAFIREGRECFALTTLHCCKDVDRAKHSLPLLQGRGQGNALLLWEACGWSVAEIS